MVTDLFVRDLDDFFEKAFGFQLKNPISTRFPYFDIIEEKEDKYRIDIAIAGYPVNNIEIYREQNRLVVVGRKPEKENENIIYNGISRKPFIKHIPISTDLEIKEAELYNGILSIKLTRDNSKNKISVKIKEISNEQPEHINKNTASK